MSFVESLTTGKTGENLINGLLMKHKVPCGGVERPYREFYDLWLTLSKFTYFAEVKYDKKSRFTGNIAIETYNPKADRRSGITKTKSDLWFQILNADSIWVCRTNDLKQFISLNCPFCDAVYKEGCGDKNANLALLKIDKVFPLLFHEVSKLETGDFIRLLNNLVE